MNHLDDRKLELVNQLRDLRKAMGLSGAELAARTGWAQSKVSRIETGRQGVTDVDVIAWCEATRAPQSASAALLAALRDIRLEESRWQRRLGGGNRPIIESGSRLDRGAQRISVFELAVVPGLVQTADYARHVLSAVSELHGSPRDTEDAVRARLARQSVLYDSTKRVEILLTEPALRMSPCPASVVAAQADWLLTVQSADSVRLGIIPTDTRLPAVAMNGFWVVDDVVIAETVNSEIEVRDPADVELYLRLLAMLWTVAVEGDAARALLAEVSAQLRARSGG